MGDVDLLTALVTARTAANVDAILGRLKMVESDDYFFDPDGSPTVNWRPDYLHWVPVGRDRGNSGRIKLAGEPPHRRTGRQRHGGDHRARAVARATC
jgi:hypothetical protein